ncbi:MAG TPA: hypothetical protein VIF09_10445 [Polyangiaceae bacterium]
MHEHEEENEDALSRTNENGAIRSRHGEIVVFVELSSPGKGRSCSGERASRRGALEVVGVEGPSTEVTRASIEANCQSIEVKGQSTEVKGGSIEARGQSIEVAEHSIEIEGRFALATEQSVEIEDSFSEIGHPFVEETSSLREDSGSSIETISRACSKKPLHVSIECRPRSIESSLASIVRPSTSIDAFFPSIIRPSISIEQYFASIVVPLASMVDPSAYEKRCLLTSPATPRAG